MILQRVCLLYVLAVSWLFTKRIYVLVAVHFVGAYFLGALFVAPSARSFDVAPEYQGFHERELERFERATDLNSEYQLIWNAYLPTLPILPVQSTLTAEQVRQIERANDHERLAGLNNRLWASIGSLSNDYFFIYSHAQISADLSDGLTFHFTHYQQRDLETDQVGQVLELRKRLSRYAQLAVYGEPSLYKRQNDLGGAVILGNPQHQHRLYHTWHDFTRNGHNNEADRFTNDGKPTSIGWLGQDAWGPWQTQMGFRYDQPTEWLRPQDDRILRYKKTTLFLRAAWVRHAETSNESSWPDGAQSAFSIEAQIDRTFKEQAPDDAASLVPHESTKLSREWVRMNYVWPFDDSRVSLATSLSAISRRWQNEKSENVQALDVLPGLTAKMRTLRRGENHDQVSVGIEATFYDKDDSKNITAGTQNDGPVEGRINTAYEFGFQNRNRLVLALNFDADDFGPLPSFEGGNGQFVIEF